MSRELFLKSKRQRVYGEGPDRKYLPSFHFVGHLHKDMIQEIMNIVEKKSGANDLYSQNYNVSKFCDLKEKLPENHVNLLLQKPFYGSSGMNEKDYTVYDEILENSRLKAFLEKTFPFCYRTRIAIMPAQSKIDWHIDMNTKVSCRFHILLRNPDFVFEIRRKERIDKIPFKESSIFFTNTAFPHRVYNPSHQPRISLLLDIEYKNVKDILLPVIKL